MIGSPPALTERAARPELNAAHDYFADTKTAWDIVDGVVVAGQTFSNTNAATGTAKSRRSRFRGNRDHSNDAVLLTIYFFARRDEIGECGASC